MMRPACAWVRALNCLQNSMMLTPCCPSAGPIGGAGLAAPAGTWSFTIAVISLAIFVLSFLLPSSSSALLDRLHLQEIELHGGRAAEDADHDLELAPFGVRLVHHPGETVERTVDHAHVLAHAELRLRRR